MTGSSSVRLGRYRLQRRIGRGGMGEVYLAHAEGTAGFEKPVVVKVLREDLVDDPNLARELAREAEICVRLDHGSIVAVLDFGVEDGVTFMVMEYVRGYSLSDLLKHLGRREEVLPTWAAAHIGRRLLDALAYVHGLTEADGTPIGLVHRDVSASNVLIAADGRVKLSDFGIARLQRGADPTDPDVIKGKSGYMAPEVLRHDEVDGRYDVFGAAAVLYRALAGVTPWGAETHARRMADVRSGKVKPIEELCPDLSPGLAAVIMRGLEREPDQRWQTAADMRAALDEAVPAEGDDPDRFRAFVAELYADPEFQAAHGQQPTVRELLSPMSDSRKAATSMSEAKTAIIREGTGALGRRALVVGGIAGALLGGAAIAYLLRPTPQQPPLVFGLSPAAGPRRAKEDAERVASYLAATTGLPIEGTVAADYKALAEELAAGRLHIAWLPPLPYREAAERGARALVTSIRGGSATYEAGLVVQRSSPAETIADLEGARTAWVDPESAAGHVFPRRLIEAEVGDVDAFLGTQRFLGSHRAACEALADGWVDMIATFLPPCEQIGTDHAKRLRVLARTPPIPGDAIAAAPELPEDTRDRLTAALTAMKHDPTGAAILAEVFNVEEFARADLAAYRF